MKIEGTDMIMCDVCGDSEIDTIPISYSDNKTEWQLDICRPCVGKQLSKFINYIKWSEPE